MSGYHTEIEKRAKENQNFREVLFTSPFIQVAIMSLKPGEDIGLETYLDTDQFICIEEGAGKAILDGVVYELKPGSGIVIPAETEYNVINVSSAEMLKLYTICIPPDYAEDTIHKTKSEGTA